MVTALLFRQQSAAHLPMPDDRRTFPVFPTSAGTRACCCLVPVHNTHSQWVYASMLLSRCILAVSCLP